MSNDAEDAVQEFDVPAELAGRRLDQALATLMPEHSRAQIQQWIAAGVVRVGALTPNQRYKLKAGERLRVEVPVRPALAARAQAIPLTVVHEDKSIIVIDKPAGLVVHPGAGNAEGTLLNALLSHAPELAQLPRAGIVHRLDKDTSGLLVVARHEAARLNLIGQLAERSMGRDYIALANGVLIAGGTVDAPIGRDVRHRTRMAVREQGKPAVTHYRVRRRYRAHSLLNVSLESGRTHQIRVHLAHIRHPLVGDPEYGGRARLPAGASESLRQALQGFKRQALHAAALHFLHPRSHKPQSFSAPLPADMQALLDALEEDLRVRA